MQVLRYNQHALFIAIRALRENKIIVYPTETAYGLGGNPFSREAVLKIYAIKQRPKEKMLPLIAASLAMAEAFFEFGEVEAELAKKYWPGPFTILLKPKIKDSELSSESHPSFFSSVQKGGFVISTLAQAFAFVNSYALVEPVEGVEPSEAGLTNPPLHRATGPRKASYQKALSAVKIAVRVSSSPIARRLSEGLGAPIISTSANLSGSATCYTVEEVLRQLEHNPEKPDIVLDAGALPAVLPSTIVEVIDGKVKVIREGAIAIK